MRLELKEEIQDVDEQKDDRGTPGNLEDGIVGEVLIVEGGMKDSLDSILVLTRTTLGWTYGDQ